MKISKVGVISHPRIEPSEKETISRIVGRLTSAGVTLFFEPVIAKVLNEAETKVCDMDVDALIVFGGDGTVLWSVNEARGEIPILAVNTGRTGFLSEIGLSGLEDNLGGFLKGDFSIDERKKLKIDGELDALNEAVVFTCHPPKILEFLVKVDGLELKPFRADGVIVSTPTGSTAYSFSANGPILHPDSDVTVITPLNPFMREQTPLVVPYESTITIELVGDKKGATLIIDGLAVKVIKSEETTTISPCERKARFIRFNKDARYSSLRKI